MEKTAHQAEPGRPYILVIENYYFTATEIIAAHIS
jgi:hypothetical protein